MAGAMLGNSGLARQLQASALGSPLESEAADDPTPGEGTKERPDYDPTRSELAPAFKLTRIARVPPALVESMLGGFSNDNTRPSGEVARWGWARTAQSPPSGWGASVSSALWTCSTQWWRIPT